MIGTAFAALVPLLSVAAACRLTGVSRATYYRRQRSPAPRAAPARSSPVNALDEDEQAAVLAVLHEPLHADLPPAQVWARLLDTGVYLCSIATMYRLLRARGESRCRSGQRSHPARARPEPVAHAPMAVWAWDITKLRGPVRGVYSGCTRSSTSTAATCPAGASRRPRTRYRPATLIADAIACCGAPKRCTPTVAGR